MSRKHSDLNLWKITSIVLFVILLAAGALFFYNNRAKKSPDKRNLYIKEISKFMVLPPDIPVLTAVDDVVKFQERDPLYFKQAKPGDVILSFRDRTILYDPKLKKILNVASIFRLPPPVPLTPLRISFRYNGKEEERAKALKSQLEGISLNYQIVEITVSQAQYKGDVVYLVNPDREEDVIFFAQALGNSPLLKNTEENEVISPNIDVIVAFRKTR